MFQVSVQDLRPKALSPTVLGCDCVSFNPSWQIPRAVLAGQMPTEAEGGERLAVFPAR